MLRTGNVHSADGWRSVLEPIVIRYRDKAKRRFFRGDAAFALPDLYEFLEAEGYKLQVHHPPQGKHDPSRARRPPAQAPRRPAAEPCAAVPCQLQLSGRILGQEAPGRRQGRMAPRRTLSSCRLHRDQPNPTGQARDRLLQSARHGGAAHQGRQERDCVDPTVRRFRNNEVRLHLHALAYNLANFMRTLALPEAVKHWSLTSLRQKLVKIGARIVGHGRYVTFQMAEVAVPRGLLDEILRLMPNSGPRQAIGTTVVSQTGGHLGNAG